MIEKKKARQPGGNGTASPLLSAALAYARRGFRVLPLKPRGKEPLLKKWPENATTDEETIKRWWLQWPDANIGIATGAENGIIVLDVDDRGALEGLEIPETVTAKTGRGGLHFYFKHPGGQIKNVVGLKPGMDLRGDRGCVVAPPSVHHSGRPYVWLKSLDVTPLADPPSWLLECLNEKRKGEATRTPALRRPKEYLREAPIPEGERNTHLTSLAGKLRADGLSEEAILEALLAENRRRCVPPLPEEEVEKIAQSIGRYPPHPNPTFSQSEQTEAPEGRRRKADILVELACQAQLWHDPEGNPWATVPAGGHKEHWRIESKNFRRWLAKQYYAREKSAPDDRALRDALRVVEYEAIMGPEYPVHTRLAYHKATGRLYLDLCDDQWRAVEIGPDGWRVIPSDQVPVKFWRAYGMLALPEPQRGGELERLRRYLNVPDESAWLLIQAWLIGAYHPTGPYPILVLQGEQGTGKSQMARFLRHLIDPNVAPLRTRPRSEEDLFIAALNGHLVALDNLSGLQDWLSDAICRLSTGGGLGKRRLYTDLEEALIDVRRPVILNGIDDLTTRDDLRDRSIVITLSPIPEEKRQEEGALWEAFRQDQPFILGAVLDAVATALRKAPNTKLPRPPRMADFAKWAEAAAQGAGYTPEAFREAYNNNRNEAAEAGIEASPVGQALLRLIKEKGEWEGTATDLLQALKTHVENPERMLPKNPRSLASQVRRLAPALRVVGVDVEEQRTRRARLIRLTYKRDVQRVGNLSSPASHRHAPPQNAQNQRFSSEGRDDGRRLIVTQKRPK
jgi:hypothetical protein